MGIVHIQDFLHLRTCISFKEAILYKTMLDVVGQIRLCFPWSQTPNSISMRTHHWKTDILLRKDSFWIRYLRHASPPNRLFTYV